MKKLVLMFVAIAAISFASCGNNAKSEEAVVEEEDTVAVDSAVDSVVVDSAAAVVEEAE